MQVSAKVEVPHAFVLVPDDLSRFWSTLYALAPTVSVEARCSDDLERSFESLDCLLTYDNPKRAEILALTFSAQSADYLSGAQLSFGGRYSTPVSMTLRGEEAVVAKLRGDLLDAIDGTKPWYSAIATTSLFNVFYPIIAFLIVLFMTMAPSNAPHPGLTLERALLAMTFASAVISVVAAAIWALYALRGRYFPKATFAIGQGSKRHAHDEQVRWVVIVGFLVNVAASVALTLYLAI